MNDRKKLRLPVRVLEACRKVGLPADEVDWYDIGQGELTIWDRSGRKYEFDVIELNDLYAGRK